MLVEVDQVLPFQCSASGLKVYRCGRWEPTAHASFAPLALTACRLTVPVRAGRLAWDQAEPFH